MGILSRTPAEAAAQLEALEVEMSKHEAAGEIDAPTYASLKYHVDRAIDRTSRVISEEHLYGKGVGIYALSDKKAWTDLVGSAHPVYARDVLSLGNKLAKVKDEHLKAHAFYKDCATYVERYRNTAQRLVDLKEKIVSTKQRRATAKDAAAVARVQTFKEYATLVVVLEQHLEAYVAKAGQLAGMQYDHYMAALEKNGWSIDVTAPRPGKGVDHHVYMATMQYRGMLISLTEPVDAAKIIRKPSAEFRAEFVERAKVAAHADYMAWIFKMIQKIGQHVDAATMVGDPWERSTITVMTRDGGRQVWHTQMIINYSKYNEAFNQFPSRRVKE